MLIIIIIISTPLSFNAIFEFHGQLTIGCIHYFFEKVLIIFEIRAQNMLFFG